MTVLLERLVGWIITSIKKNFKRKTDGSHLSETSVTDATWIPLVESSVLRYGDTDSVSLVNYNNEKGKLYYKFALTVHNNNNNFMVWSFLSHVMSQTYAKKVIGFLLGLYRKEDLRIKKAFYSISGMHSQLHTISSCAWKFIHEFALYSCQELRLHTENILLGAFASAVSTRYFVPGVFDSDTIQNNPAAQKQLNFFKSVVLWRNVGQFTLKDIFIYIADLTLRGVSFNKVMLPVDLERSILNKNVDYDTRVCYLSLLCRTEINIDISNVTLKGRNKKAFKIYHNNSGKPGYSLISFLKGVAQCVAGSIPEHDWDQSTLFKDALFPLLDELKEENLELYNAYSSELFNLWSKGETAGVESEFAAFTTWRLIVGEEHKVHPDLALGSMDFMSYFNALAVFHKVPHDLRDESEVLTYILGGEFTKANTMPSKYSLEGLDSLYIGSEMSNDLRELLVHFFMTFTYPWEYSQRNPFAVPNLLIRFQLNDQAEIFNSLFMNGITKYFRGEITSKNNYVIFTEKNALHAMRFLQTSVDTLKKPRPMLGEDYLKYPNILEFENAQDLHELFYDKSGKKIFTMAGYCFDHYLDEYKSEPDEQLAFIKKFVTADMLLVKHHVYRLHPWTCIWIPRSSESPALTIAGLFYSDVLLLDRYAWLLTRENRGFLLWERKKLYDLLACSNNVNWSKPKVQKAFEQAGEIMLRDKVPVQNDN